MDSDSITTTARKQFKTTYDVENKPSTSIPRIKTVSGFLNNVFKKFSKEIIRKYEYLPMNILLQRNLQISYEEDKKCIKEDRLDKTIF